MFRSRCSQARVARALVARAGLGDLWHDDGPTPEARLLAEAEHLPLGRRERALCRLAWLLWDGSTEIGLGELLDLTDSDDLRTVAELLEAMSVGADAVDAWVGTHLPPSAEPPPVPDATGNGSLPPRPSSAGDVTEDGEPQSSPTLEPRRRPEARANRPPPPPASAWESITS